MQNLCRHHGLFKHFRHSDREAGVSGVLLKRSSWSHLRYRPKFPLQHLEFYRRVLQFGDFTLMGEKKTDDCYVTRRAKLQKCLTARGIYCPCLTQQHYVKSERVLSGTYVLFFRDYTTSFFFFFKLYTKHVSLCRGKRAICPSAARVMFQTSFLFISCSVEVFLLLFLSASLHVKL